MLPELVKDSPLVVQGVHGDYLKLLVAEKELNLVNNSKDEYLFRVLLTRADYYNVSPSNGFLKPGESKSISIKLRKDMPHVKSNQNDKFQIKGCAVKHSFKDKTESELWKEAEDEDRVHKFSYQTLFFTPPPAAQSNESEKLKLAEKELLKQKSQVETLKNDILILQEQNTYLEEKINMVPIVSEVPAAAPAKESAFDESQLLANFNIFTVIKATLNGEVGPASAFGKQTLILFFFGIIIGFILRW